MRGYAAILGLALMALGVPASAQSVSTPRIADFLRVESAGDADDNSHFEKLRTARFGQNEVNEDLYDPGLVKVALNGSFC